MLKDNKKVFWFEGYQPYLTCGPGGAGVKGLPPPPGPKNSMSNEENIVSNVTKGNTFNFLSLDERLKFIIKQIFGENKEFKIIVQDKENKLNFNYQSEKFKE